jgi:hypothetical protein
MYSADLTPYEVTTAATTTASKYRVRAFGESDNSDMVQQTIVRYQDKCLELGHELMPRDLRIEMLRRRRRARDALTEPRKDRPLEAHSDLKAQQRYGEWMMRTDVPEAARRAKAEMLPYFEGLVTATTGDESCPLPQQASKRSVSSHSEPHVDLENAELVSETSSGQGHKLKSSKEDEGAAMKAIADFEFTVNRLKSKTSANSRGELVSMSSPKTAEDIGDLFLQMDAMKTILEVDSSEIGGFAHRCPAGWRSGYRAEPMSKEEIRKAHIVQKFCAGNSHAHAQDAFVK